MGIPQSQMVNLNKSRERAQYWRLDEKGNWMLTGFLPADPLSIQYYFSKGFKGKQPLNVQVDEVGDNSNLIKCPMCEFGAKNAFGLQAHFKKHLKKEENI